MAFPIPMRGNEQVLSNDPLNLDGFPIPMRGNENYSTMFRCVTLVFPIPMRGNEATDGVVTITRPFRAEKVSNPHEG